MQSFELCWGEGGGGFQEVEKAAERQGPSGGLQDGQARSLVQVPSQEGTEPEFKSGSSMPKPANPPRLCRVNLQSRFGPQRRRFVVPPFS